MILCWALFSLPKASKVSAWYKNERGQVTQNWPFNLIEYWQQTRKPNPDDYTFL